MFDDVSLMINPGDRIGLVGRNGTGKSTLLNMINGDEKPNKGSIAASKNLVIGYLKQDINFTDDKTVLEETEAVFKEVKGIESEIGLLKVQLDELNDESGDKYLHIIDRISELEEKFRILDGFSVQSEIRKVLTGLGFLQSDFGKKTSTFSGGWRMRIELAKLLLQKPDLLLLDEPTNHLDIESIIWLEQWLKSFPGAIVLVSHDRIFLNEITNRTIEITFGKVIDYKASYSKYVEIRKERQLNMEQAKKNQDKFIKHTEELINKFRYNKKKAAFAQSLIKKLEKLDRIDVDRDDTSAMHFRFPPAPHSGKVTIKACNVFKNYGTLQVLNDISFELVKGEKIAFVGKNGEGKTTLAKVVVGEIEFKGELKLGHMVKVGYYAQNQSDLLDDDITVLQTIEDAATEKTSSGVRNVLGSFLFSGDTVNKKVSVLSGGERARLALCRMLMEPFNLLIMDEPTRHLDMLSKDILKQAMIQYDGTMIIVSHDRSFLKGLTNKVYEFKNKNIKEYIGDVTDYLEVRNLVDFKQLETISASKNGNKDKPGEPSANKLSYEAKKQLQRDVRKANNRSGRLEREITELEEELKQMDVELADPVRFKELSTNRSYFEDYDEKQLRLKELMNEWEDAQVKLEELKNKQKESA